MRMAEELKADKIRVNAVMISAFKMSKESVRVSAALAYDQSANLLPPSPDSWEQSTLQFAADEFRDISGKLINKIWSS